MLTDVGASRQLLDTCTEWARKSGVFRICREKLTCVATWEDPCASGVLLLIWNWLLLSPDIRIPFFLIVVVVGFWYTSLLVASGVLGGSQWKATIEDVRSNIAFNQECMNSWCKTYDEYIMRPCDHAFPLRIVYYCVGVYIWSLILPVRWLLMIAGDLVLCYHCPILNNYSLATRFYLLLIPSPITSHPTSGQRQETHTVYENQRWWLGNWSDKGLSIGMETIHPWSDASGHKKLNRQEITLPCDNEWAGPWQAEGWMYAINFSSDEFHPHQNVSDFVRRRKWTRACTKKAIE